MVSHLRAYRIYLLSLNQCANSHHHNQPPKKRSAPSSGPAPKRARQSKLAKENDISASEENEIKEVFHLFSETVEEFADQKEGVIPRGDVRKALVYGIPSLRIRIAATESLTQ